MKKNLLSVLILVLMLVNIALSAVMMTNVISTNQKTAELMDSIGAAMITRIWNCILPVQDPKYPSPIRRHM